MAKIIHTANLKDVQADRYNGLKISNAQYLKYWVMT